MKRLQVIRESLSAFLDRLKASFTNLGKRFSQNFADLNAEGLQLLFSGNKTLHKMYTSLSNIGSYLGRASKAALAVMYAVSAIRAFLFFSGVVGNFFGVVMRYLAVRAWHTASLGMLLAALVSPTMLLAIPASAALLFVAYPKTLSSTLNMLSSIAYTMTLAVCAVAKTAADLVSDAVSGVKARVFGKSPAIAPDDRSDLTKPKLEKSTKKHLKVVISPSNKNKPEIVQLPDNNNTADNLLNSATTTSIEQTTTQPSAVQGDLSVNLLSSQSTAEMASSNNNDNGSGVPLLFIRSLSNNALRSLQQLDASNDSTTAPRVNRIVSPTM